MAVLMFISFSACSNEQEQPLWEDDEPYTLEQYAAIYKGRELWLAGKQVSLRTTVSEFPAVLPELFRDIAFDETDPKQRALTKTVSAQTDTLYYEVGIQADSDHNHSYESAVVSSFYMVGGRSGHIRAWGVTFGMTKEEAEAAIQDYFDMEKVFPDRNLPIETDRSSLLSELTDTEKEYAGITDTSTVELLSYRMETNRLDLLIVNGTVRGIRLIAAEMVLAIA